MPFTNYKVAAAWSVIVGKLTRFKRGDDIALEWLQNTGTIDDGIALEGRLRTHFVKLGIVIVRRRDHYHLLTDAEQKEHAAGRRQHTKREDARTLKEIVAVDRSKLDDRGRQEADHLQRHAIARLEDHTKFEKESRAILGVPEPRPQLRAVADEKPKR